MVCAGCGHQIADNAAACVKCGLSLTQPSTAPAPELPAEPGQHSIPVWVFILILGVLFIGIGQLLVILMGRNSLPSLLSRKEMNLPNITPPSLYDGMAMKLHAGMTFDSVVAQLGRPYLPAYNVGDHVSAIYRANGTILPFLVRFQKVESLVINDPSAEVDSWCAYVQIGDPGDSSVLLFAPKSMSAEEQARWIAGHGLSFPGQARIKDADPNRPQGDGGATKLVEAQSVHNPADMEGSQGVELVDRFKLRLACHPVL